MEFREFTNGPININLAEKGKGPVILCVTVGLNSGTHGVTRS